MTRYNGCGCGGHTHNGCSPCTSHNEIQQAVNDALALEKENLEQYETNAAQSATNAAQEAADAAASASASAQSQTNAETAAGTAVAASKVVTDTAVVLEETAEAVKAAQALLDDKVSALQTKPVYFEVSEPTTVLTLPESTLVFNVRSIYVASARQDVGYGFEFNKTAQTVILAEGITAEQIAETEEGYVLVTVICDLSSSDDPTSLAILLASNAGASLIGTSTEATVELALKARPTYDELAANTGASLIGHLGFKAPEWYGAVGDGLTNDTAIIQSLISVPGAKVYLSKTYLVTAGVLTPAEGVKIFGPGKLIGTTTESFTWSTSNRASDYPVIWVTSANVTIEAITIESPYEAVQAASGGNNLVLRYIIGGGTESTHAQSSAFVFFNVDNVLVEYCTGQYTGSEATWDSVNSDIKSGGCDGFDFGAVNYIKLVFCYSHHVGRNGINWYGASHVFVINCRQYYCGQNGVQPGPHPNYKTATIRGNDATYCCADAIDCRYTGSSAVEVDLTVSDCTSDWIGMLYGDVNYISNDGTGGVTLAMVYNANISNVISNNASGVIMWMEGCHNVNYNNIQGYSSYTRYGMGFFTSSYNIKVSNTNIICKGPALWYGGSSTFSNFKVSNSYFESTDSYAFLMPNNTLSSFRINNVEFLGYRLININFPTESVTVKMLGTTESAVYLGTAYVRHSKLTVTGTTSAVLVQVGVGTGVVLENSELTNAGSGTTLSLVAAVGFNLVSSRVWNTGTGNSIMVSGGQNGSVFAYCDIYSVAGKWMESTAASHTRFLTIANRENGAVTATWTSITNVLNMSTTQRT